MQSKGQIGNDAEDRFQQELAKKLGLKKGRLKVGDDDGLDSLLKGTATHVNSVGSVSSSCVKGFAEPQGKSRMALSRC